ncbi:hypothetical protein [Amycolatopsis sp. lyj-90]|uniref:hypothetical protein n=1 Tax=Amycolatopsis sp. lyj-90 TaxID=2789285 RepID=UPI0039787AC0
MTDVGSQTIDAVRAGRFVTRTLAVLGGVVAAWLAGEATASADTAAIDVPTELQTAVGEIDQARSWIEEQASPVTQETTDSVNAVVDRVAGPSDYLVETLKPAMGVVTATTEQVTGTPFDIVILRQPSEIVRGNVAASPLDSGVPVSVPAFADTPEPSGPPCRYETAVDHPAPVTYPPPSGHDAATPNPLWPTMSTCGTATSVATASGSDHKGGAVLSGRIARDFPLLPGYSDFRHQAVRAVSIRPAVTPG